MYGWVGLKWSQYMLFLIKVISKFYWDRLMECCLLVGLGKIRFILIIGGLKMLILLFNGRWIRIKMVILFLFGELAWVLNCSRILLPISIKLCFSPLMHLIITSTLYLSNSLPIYTVTWILIWKRNWQLLQEFSISIMRMLWRKLLLEIINISVIFGS